MVKRAVVMTGSLILGLALAPFAAQGGMAAGPQPRGFAAHPEFRPSSAFGSPGGFPFMARLDRRNSRVFDRRIARLNFFPAFPATSFWYGPSVPYATPADVPPPVTNVAPVTYVSPTVYVSVPAVAAAPAMIAAPAAPPSTPSVVEYATGRYELRGDGSGTPYTWVWIPNPPPGPPPGPPESPASTTSPVSGSHIYRWTDDQGTEFWTNRLEKIPEPYRSRVGSQAQLAAQQQ